MKHLNRIFQRAEKNSMNAKTKHFKLGEKCKREIAESKQRMADAEEVRILGEKINKLHGVVIIENMGGTKKAKR
jgi:hypothetical protein